VTYTYLPSDYWNPIRLFDIGSVETRFGFSYASTIDPVSGQLIYTGIGSQLSFAARVAFENGAQSVICQPLFVRATPGDPSTAQQAPSAADVGNQTTWSDTLYVLRPIIDLDIIVPIIGNDGNVNVTDGDVLNVFEAVQGHLAYQNTQQQYIVTIMGEDGTSSASEASSLIATMRNTHAPDLQANFGNSLSSQMVLINNTVFQRSTPGGINATINVGGQYCAAAFAGGVGGRSVSSSMTRAPILGFQSISDTRTTGDKNADAGAGLTVIEQVGSLIRCRQGNTLDTQDGPAGAELSVVRAKFLMMESIMATINNQIIGQIIADANSPMVVSSAISGVLGLLQQSGTIVGYSAVTSALTSLNPTTIQATFSYKPAFPLNYVEIVFALDLTSNTISVVNNGTGISGSTS
jgi:hypothetical protein